MHRSKGMHNYSEVNRVFAHHYASTPHLFVFQSDENSDYNNQISQKIASTNNLSTQKTKPEPIYSTAYDLKKEAAQNEMKAAQKISEKYDTLPHYRERQDSLIEDPLLVTEDDIARIETFFSGHKTQVWVCTTMANLYFEKGTGSKDASWNLKFTGVPLLLLDAGDTRSREKRQLQIILAEKGTGFALWKDVIDNLTSYKVQQEHFHTFYLSTDHRQKLGLSFNDGPRALQFYDIVETLTSNPANISLSGPGKKKEKIKEKIAKYKPPKKTNISLPCNFSHITNVDITDKSRYFSLQLFSKKIAEEMPAPPIDLYPQDNLREDIKSRSVQV